MKKGTIIALIVAVALLLGGGVMLALGLSYAGEGMQKSLLTEQEVTLAEDFHSVLIDTGDCNVEFVPYKGAADTQIVIREREKTRHSVSVEEGILKIEMTDNREWTDYIGVNWESMEMTVYLPQKQYVSLRITTDTGDIRIPEAVSGQEMLLRSSTGDIYCEGKAAELLDCMTDTGHIHVRGCTTNRIKLQASTGDLYLCDVQSTEIHLQNSTGDKEVKNVVCKTLTCNSNTGDVELERVSAEEYLQVFTTTGEVEIENSDAGKVNIETDTGDICLPAAWKDQDIHIETDTGDIHFE